uniref:Ribosomal protein S30 n=1 Tax=Riptortus pedestris TaxID=329032 RepID=R4WCS1_RIPPE|nr:ribosomal protein S30 [Riptortus pedestris]
MGEVYDIGRRECSCHFLSSQQLYISASFVLVINILSKMILDQMDKKVLFIRGQETHMLECNGDESLAVIKERVSGLEQVPHELTRLACGGVPLSDDILVSQLDSHNLDLTVPLLGGKVHGSLARAGKVKGQTPKVEKMEKKKKKTGRAKRRIQYNRRFVNVVQTFGRRRGPNSRS